MNLKQGTELQGGKYRIIKVLGQGGFGITYLAEQVTLDRRVAVKEFFMKDLCNRDNDSSAVYVGSVGSRETVERFRQKFLKEARLIASLDNPHIIRIIDVFEENSTAYYVMEYLEGESLYALVSSKGALPEIVAVEYICQVANALMTVHLKNFLHLDVKPANIMLNKRGEAVLIDFGVSKHYDESGEQTSSAAVGISEGYAPIEQYERSALKNFRPVTDIYALGATLFFLLTGKRPPKASEVMNYGLPPLPKTISADVRNAVERAMQPSQIKRPQSVEKFIALLCVNEITFIPQKEPVLVAKRNRKPLIITLMLLVVAAVLYFAFYETDSAALERIHTEGQAAYGIGDYEKAVELFREGAEIGDADSQYNLGRCYYNGYGVEQSYEEAVKWYRLASDQGYAEAQCSFGVCYYDGNGVDQSYEEAVRWYRLAADQGYAGAQYNLGICYYGGYGVEQSYEEAARWWRLAADQGLAVAQCSLGNCYYEGNGVEQSYDEAVRWYRLAADQGYAEAQCSLGFCYYDGNGVDQSYEEAVRWYRLAADQGHAGAQNNLGNCYYKGYGVDQSYEKAVKWYRLAADQGNADAQYDLARCYMGGNGIERSYEEAEKWLRLAAEQGHAYAIYDLQYNINMNAK